MIITFRPGSGAGGETLAVGWGTAPPCPHDATIAATATRTKVRRQIPVLRWVEQRHRPKSMA
jgi:hypothetical protein